MMSQKSNERIKINYCMFAQQISITRLVLTGRMLYGDGG